MFEQLIKYALIQIVAYIIDFSSFIFFIDTLEMKTISANLFAKLISGSLAFIAHKYITFQQGQSGHGWRETVNYFLLLGFNIVFTSTILPVVLFYLPTKTAKIFTDISCLGITFLLTKTLVFKEAKE
jgi:putative flippase GtrA